MSIDVEREMREIQTSPWPHHPLLPVIDRSYRNDPSKSGGWPDAGVITWREDWSAPVVVYKVNIFELDSLAAKWREEHDADPTYADLLGSVEKAEYPSLRAMVEYGWLAD